MWWSNTDFSWSTDFSWNFDIGIDTTHIEKVLMSVSYHEAGHAVVCHELGARVVELSVAHDKGDFKGHCNYRRYDSNLPADAIVDAAITYAGWLAEVRAGLSGFGKSKKDVCDITKALTKIKSLIKITNWRSDLRESRALASRIITERWDEIESLGMILYKHRHLTARQCDGFFLYGEAYLPAHQPTPLYLQARHKLRTVLKKIRGEGQEMIIVMSADRRRLIGFVQSAKGSM